MRQILDHIMLGDNNTDLRCGKSSGCRSGGPLIMTDNPNKKTFWDKVHLDPTMLLILLALLVYSARLSGAPAVRILA